MNLHEILKLTRDGIKLTKEQLIYMLELPPDSVESYKIMAAANKISKELTGNNAEVHAQFALNLAPCPRNCKFCSFAEVNKIFKSSTKISVSDAISKAKQFESDGANAIFVMCTGNFDFGEFIEISGEIRRNLKKKTTLIANIGDINHTKAKKLKETGFQGLYHAIRLREGTDTLIDPQKRLDTIEVCKNTGLSVGTCVEPIGPEHTNEEIADMILLTASIAPAYSGAARRISIPGSELSKYGMISELRMAQIVAITRLGMPLTTKGNCTHEPCGIGAFAGANLFWAEVGANPRDVKEKTEKGRGKTVKQCKHLFNEINWEVLSGPSKFYKY